MLQTLQVESSWSQKCKSAFQFDTAALQSGSFVQTEADWPQRWCSCRPLWPPIQTSHLWSGWVCSSTGAEGRREQRPQCIFRVRMWLYKYHPRMQTMCVYWQQPPLTCPLMIPSPDSSCWFQDEKWVKWKGCNYLVTPLKLSWPRLETCVKVAGLAL